MNGNYDMNADPNFGADTSAVSRKSESTGSVSPCDECLNANIDSSCFVGTVLGCFKNHEQVYDKKRMYTFQKSGNCGDFE